MKIAIPAEIDAAEPRVAATPDSVKKMIALGGEVMVETGAGVKSGVLDADYEAAGAAIEQRTLETSPRQTQHFRAAQLLGQDHGCAHSRRVLVDLEAGIRGRRIVQRVASVRVRFKG